MLGAIAGDMAGSAYEHHPWQGKCGDIPLFSPRARFTDDTVLTIAVAHGIMAGQNDETLTRKNIRDNLKSFAAAYPHAGYGSRFRQWCVSANAEPFGSFGNGSAMRVSPVGWAFATIEDVEKFAAISADVTHNHPEGIRGARAVAGAIFLARTGADKNAIRDYVMARYGYDLTRSLALIRENYHFDVTCQGSVPEAITAFLESESYADAIRKAIWLRGDSDTQAAIAGSIAEAFYGCVPEPLASNALELLDENLYMKYMEWQAWLNSSSEQGQV